MIINFSFKKFILLFFCFNNFIFYSNDTFIENQLCNSQIQSITPLKTPSNKKYPNKFLKLLKKNIFNGFNKNIFIKLLLVILKIIYIIFQNRTYVHQEALKNNNENDLNNAINENEPHSENQLRDIFNQDGNDLLNIDENFFQSHVRNNLLNINENFFQSQDENQSINLFNPHRNMSNEEPNNFLNQLHRFAPLFINESNPDNELNINENENRLRLFNDNPSTRGNITVFLNNNNNILSITIVFRHHKPIKQKNLKQHIQNKLRNKNSKNCNIEKIIKYDSLTKSYCDLDDFEFNKNVDELDTIFDIKSKQMSNEAKDVYKNFYWILLKGEKHFQLIDLNRQDLSTGFTIEQTAMNGLLNINLQKYFKEIK